MADMNDREALEALLRRFGLEPYTEELDPAAYDAEARAVWARRICLAAGHGGVNGYGGFEATFEFDADGNFKSLSIWE